MNYVEKLNGKSEEIAQILCFASRHPRSSMSILLLQKGAKINAHTKDYEYPLHIACRYQSLQNIHLFLSLGADLTLTNVRGFTPLCCMSSNPFTESLKLVIRHLAIMISKSLPVRANDLAKINRHSRLREYYEECLSELSDMQKTRIYSDNKFFCFIDKNLEELCELVRHVDFLKTYYQSQKDGSILFPRYSMYIHNVFKMAIDRKNILIAKASVYEEACYMDVPPYGMINHVAQINIPELDNFERKFYFKLHERINDSFELGYHMNLLY